MIFSNFYTFLFYFWFFDHKTKTGQIHNMANLLSCKLSNNLACFKTSKSSPTMWGRGVWFLAVYIFGLLFDRSL